VNTTLYDVSVWVLPLIIAITFHEAAHGFVAHHFGDNTAWDRGRVSFNPLRHIDPFGTLIMPAILLLSHSPFLFGYAKPVPVNFRALRNPRIDMVWVALAGPATNIALALIAATAFHIVDYVPESAAQWLADNLKTPLSSTSSWRSSTCCQFRRWTAGALRSASCPQCWRRRWPGWSRMGC
jgi:hypothetical protein